VLGSSAMRVDAGTMWQSQSASAPTNRTSSGLCFLWPDHHPVLHPLCRYTRDEDDVEALERDATEESGWKLVHGDVFRPPRHPELLSALVGTGKHCQLCPWCMMFVAQRCGTAGWWCIHCSWHRH
jgi:Endomembrane protein 70